MSTFPRHRNLPQLLLQAREALMIRFRPVLKANGVTEQQWRIVRALLIHGPLEPRQLCALCQISSPSIVGVLQRMEEAGLVARERMADDQRRVSVSATARSRQIGRRLFPAIEARYEELEAIVGVDTLQRAYEVLDAILEPLERVAGDAQERNGRAERSVSTGRRSR